jgi:HEAT repeat protein
MGIFDHNRKKIGKTEFIKDPLAFIRFLREDNEKLVEFGQTSLIAAGKEVIPALIDLLSNEQEDIVVRRRAGTVLSRIGEPAVDAVRDAARNGETGDREMFKMVLGQK